MLVDVLDRAEFLDKGGGILLSDPRYSRDVVGGVSDQRFVVYESGRFDSVALLDRFLVEDLGVRKRLPPNGSQDLDLRRHQLEGIVVPGDDHRLHPVLPGLAS